jgi:hypothetical protein
MHPAQAPGKSRIDPWPAWLTDQAMVTEDRSAEDIFVPYRTGPGTQWVHAEPAGGGVHRVRAVTSGSEEPQVKPLAQPRPGNSGRGGPEFESPHPAAASLRALANEPVGQRSAGLSSGPAGAVAARGLATSLARRSSLGRFKCSVAAVPQLWSPSGRFRILSELAATQ